MATVSVSVRKSGKIIDKIERPLRQVGGAAAVVYRHKTWLLSDGMIDLDSKPLLQKSKKTTPNPRKVSTGPRTPPAPTELSLAAGKPKKKAIPVLIDDTPEAPDDGAERSAILNASAEAKMLVEAGPGTGKTQMAALRLARLVSGSLSPGRVLVLSFSRSAVRTLTKRLEVVAEAEPHVIEELRHISIRTFDAWTFRMLRLLGEDPNKLIARTYDDNIAALTEMMAGSRGEALRNQIGDRRHLFVDEFQDLPGVRGELVLSLLKLIAPPGESRCGFTVLGDPAQGIFSFAAKKTDGTNWPSAQEYWKRIKDLYGSDLQLRTLVKNHRSDSRLAALSRQMRRILLSDLPGVERLDAIKESVSALPSVDGAPNPSWLVDATGKRAVLTRTNGEALRVLQMLLGHENEGPPTPVRLRVGGFMLPPAWISGLLRKVPQQTVTRAQFTRIYSYLMKTWGSSLAQQLGLPEVGVAWSRLAIASGVTEQDSSIELSELRARLGWPDAFPDDQGPDNDGLLITTIHQSKGMEFDDVTVLEGGEAEGWKDDGDPAERASVAYVAVTRAARVLRKLPPESVSYVPYKNKFNSGSVRWISRGPVQTHMEMGLRGDVDPTSFVCPKLHGGRAGVENVQQYLLTNAKSLEGCKVVLCWKYDEQKKGHWNIHLQEGATPGLLLGCTGVQLTWDINEVKTTGKSFPGRIWNLRIGSVGTLTCEADRLHLEEPDRTSRLWLGISIFGTGSFSLKKKT